MSLLSQASDEGVAELAKQVTSALREAATLEAAAQFFVNGIVERFPTVVLARVFATIPYGRLPNMEATFAAKQAEGIALFPTTPVLTLFGTAGSEPDWNTRRNSRGHLAIPLVNREYVANIPMVSRLFRDLRYDLPQGSRSNFVTRAFANANGLFFVADAKTSVDELGRKIVPAADFVRERGIVSCFGFGGSYIVQPVFVSTILFTTEALTRAQAMNFLQLSSAFKAGTTRAITRSLFFDQQNAAAGNG